jgi:hypothetical protein
VEDEMAITGVPRNPHSFLRISVERLADGDGWPGKRGDLWPLWVSIAVDVVLDSAAAPVDDRRPHARYVELTRPDPIIASACGGL